VEVTKSNSVTNLTSEDKLNRDIEEAKLALEQEIILEEELTTGENINSEELAIEEAIALKQEELALEQEKLALEQEELALEQEQEEEEGEVGVKYEKKIITEEVIPTFKSSTFGFDTTETLEEAMEGINESSLNNLLRKHYCNEILEEIGKASEKVSDFDERYTLLTDYYGYDFKSTVFQIGELEAVIKIIEGYAETQSKLPKLSLKDKARILFDFDRNGKLESSGINSVSELEMESDAFEDLTSDGFEALIDNLGLGPLESFTKKMSENLFLTRENFKRALGVALRGAKNLSELFIK
jgi:hypothetical protein